MHFPHLSSPVRRVHLAVLALALVASTAACDKSKPDEDAPAVSDTAAGAKDTAATVAETVERAGDKQGPAPLARVMRYLDPKARAVLVLTKTEKFDYDPETLGTVMALPPGATRLLEAATRANQYLDPEGRGHPAWLASEMMVVTPGAGTRDYLVVRRAGTESEMLKAFDELGLVLAEGVEPKTWRTSGRFPFKVTALDDDVLALIASDELGSGLAPLTAGRDLPPSEMQTELGNMLSSDKAIELALHAGGPMLHLDISSDIAATQLGLRLDGPKQVRAQTVLAPTANPDQAAKEINQREHPEETQAVQGLMKRVVFVVDKDVLVGEIELNVDDLALLK